MTVSTTLARRRTGNHGGVFKRIIRVFAQVYVAPALLTAHLFAQIPVQIPPETNLFSDEIVKKIQTDRHAVLMIPPRAGVNSPAKLEGWAHTLIFRNGQQLRGEIIALTKSEILWKHPDSAEPLRFRCDDVRRVTFSSSAENSSTFFVSPGQPRSLEDPARSGFATVKLPGGDWLHGALSSTDGEIFALKLAEGTEINLKREAISWLYFGGTPSPAYGYSGSPLEIEGWLGRAPSAQPRVEDGTLSIRGADSIGRGFRPISQVELNFELPEGGEDGLRIWLQPMGPEVNSYTTGTVEMQLGNREFRHCIYTNRLEHISTPIPRTESEMPGPIRYKILYDGERQELTVIRNGQQLGNWDFVDEKDKQAEQYLNRVFQITGICFQYQPEGKNQGLRFNSLSVQPWDGGFSAENTVLGSGDCMFSLGGRSRPGHLNRLSGKEVIFSGEKLERRADMFLRFAQNPAPIADATAMLLFGEQGEISVADLDISDGKIRGRTSFEPALETPIAAVRSIAFSSSANIAPLPKQPDTLVFKNGDEIAGSLIAAAKNEAWRWRTVTGQEVTFRPDHIAGVRISAGAGQASPPNNNNNTATVELRNGDYLRGDLIGLDANKLQFRHGQLGSLMLDQSQLWGLYPSNRWPVYDGGNNPEAWMSRRPWSVTAGEEPSAPPEYNRWVYLDGHYILRPQPNGYSFDPSLTLTAPSRQIPECFELRCDVTHATGGEPNFNLQLSNKDTGSVQASVAYGRLHYFLFSRKAVGRTFSKQIPLYDKLPEPSSRRNLRLFVNSRAGTADLFIDGVPIAKIGYQEAERLPGLGERIGLTPNTPGTGALIISNLWMGPWNGELPKPEVEDTPAVALANGDSSSGKPTGFRDGKLQIESEVGPLDLPIDKVLAVEFGGAMSPHQAAARIRLADGSAIHVDDFRWENDALIAHGEVLGDLRLSANLISEVALNPAPARAPKIAVPKNLARKPAAQPDQAEPADAKQ